MNDGPHVQSQALKAHCEKLLTVKAGNEKAALKKKSVKVLFCVRYVLLNVLNLSQCSADCIVTED